MKTILLAAIIVFSTQTQGHGEELASCESIGGLAEDVMRVRQKGTPMSQVMNAIGELDIGRQLTLMAYEKHLFYGEEMKAIAIADFRSTIELACYKERQK